MKNSKEEIEKMQKQNLLRNLTNNIVSSLYGIDNQDKN